jgi:predicted transcriptional regulator YheO
MKRNIKLEGIIHSNKGLLDKENEVVFHALKAVVDSVAEAFGTNCEVVLHSLEDPAHSVVKIVNGHVTGRKVGAPLTDLCIEILHKAKSSGRDVIGSYYSRLDDGRLLKSVSTLIRNAQGDPIGIMCINIDLSVPLLDFLEGFLPRAAESAENIVEHFPLTLNELVSKTLETVMTRMNTQKELSSSDRNKAIVMELYKRGMFKVTGVIDIVAKKLGISRYTVYNYIREAKVEIGEEV